MDDTDFRIQRLLQGDHLGFARDVIVQASCHDSDWTYLDKVERPQH